MVIPKLTPLLNSTHRAVVKHAPDLLMGVGTICSISAMISAAKVSPLAKLAVEAKKVDIYVKEHQGESCDTVHLDDCRKLTFWEWIKAVARYYGPVVAVEILALFCFWAAHGIDIRRQAMLAGLATTAEEALREYQQKVKQMIGDKAEKEIRNDISQDRVNRLPPPPDKNPMPPGTAKDWCIIKNGEWTSPYFLNTYIGIKDAQNQINQDMICNMYASESDLFWLLDPDRRYLKTTGKSGQMGWDIDRLLELEVTKCDGPDHETVYVICYKDKDGCDYPPRPNFNISS